MTSEINFDADSVVDEAVERTGFDDFGETPYREGLEALLATYDRNVPHPVARKRCHARVRSQLATRLRLENAFKSIDGWQTEEIRAPVFVTGLPRSGTSALSNLLEVDPRNRSPLQWEVQFPDVWPGSRPGEKDPRYDSLASAIEASRDSEFARIHYLDANTPAECVQLHVYALHGVLTGVEVMLEPYRSWLLAQDFGPLYRFQKKVMQLLAWRHPGKCWMLKAPAHMWGIDAILENFPDARFVWCHRDPQIVVPSINSMTRTLMKKYLEDYSHLDMGEIGRKVMEWYALSLERGLEQRSRLPQKLFVDSSQQAFVDDPMRVVEKVYDALGIELGPDTRAMMQAHVDANPKGKHGKHEYHLEEYGLTRQMVDERFAFYTNDQRWPISA